MAVIRHVEFTLSDDLTTWAEDWEDFEGDNVDDIKWNVSDCFASWYECMDKIQIKSVWYEEK